MTPFSAASPSPRARAAALDLGAFVTASPSSFHAAREAARRLAAAGFTELVETAPWTAGDVAGDRFVLRDGSLIAWSAPEGADAATPFRIVGSHTDSPALKVKPDPRFGAEGLSQVGVEIYGGPLLNSWLDRELRLAGRLALADGSTVLVDTPGLLRIPQLAVHLDRGVNKDGLTLDPQRHMQPVLGFAGLDVLEILAHHAGVDRAEIVGLDVVTVDAQAPALFGADEEFLASGRLDNLSSVHAEIEALRAVAAGERAGTADGPAPIALMVANDHEEVGSATRSGAAGPFLADMLVRIAAGLGYEGDAYQALLARSSCISADAGHSVNPNYVGKHDPTNHPLINRGPVLKINSNQRYATGARGGALFRRLCNAASVPMQTFVGNNDVPCGTTIGPLTATRLGILTVDVGIPLLSMHSAREMCGVSDPLMINQAFVAYWSGV